MEQIGKALHSPDEETRLQGLRDLATGEYGDGLDLIFKAFGDESWRVRKQAIDLFLSMPASREMIGEVIELLHAEENAGLRNAAVEILTRMGRCTVPMLIEHARCPDHDVRKFIIDVLGDIAAPEAVPVLTAGLEDTDSNVRAAAAENLGKLRTREAVPALLKAMQLPDLLLQFTILDALSRIAVPVPLSELLAYKDEKLLRKALIDCLGKAGDASAVPELVKALTDPMRNVRESAIQAIVDIYQRHPAEIRKALAECEKGPVVATVNSYLDDEFNDTLRLASIKILGWLAAEGAVEKLLSLLDFETLQQTALDALVDIGRENPQALLDTWAGVSGARRAYLAYVLGESDCIEALSLLTDTLQDEDIQVVRMAVHALGRIGTADNLPELVACLHCADDEVRTAATQALTSLGEKLPDETFLALQPLLNHADAVQRELAVVVLRELDHPDILNTLARALKDSSAEVRRAAVKIFARHPVAEHLSTLLLALTDEDAEVRMSAVEVLANCSDESVLDGLQLAMQDEDIWVRAAAVRGLGKITGERSRNLVAQALADPVGLVCIAALETLAGMSGAAAVPQMISALDHNDEEVVTAAINLLTSHDSGEWMQGHAEKLINHPFWLVRSQIVRTAAEALGVEARPLLERRLEIETEEVVRQQLADTLAALPAG